MTQIKDPRAICGYNYVETTLKGAIMAKVIREVIKIDEELCDGCGLCVIRGEVKDRPMFAGL